MITVLIADDQELIRDGLRMILSAQDDIEVIGEAASGRAALSQARRLRPDVVLMDIVMPDIDGIEATRRLQAQPELRSRVLILTTYGEDEQVYAALAAGASGFLLKDAPRARLLAAVRTVAAGEEMLDPTITRRLVERFSRPSAEAKRLAVLTQREVEVMGAMARGLSNAEIAEHLTLGEATVKTHVARILSKLGVRDRVQVVIAAYECGLVRPGGDGRPPQPSSRA
jgi:DNA-binding NarL/FixJ family response regulator